MSDPVLPAVIAVGAGVAVAFLVLVPFVTMLSRRHGGVRLRDLLLGLVVLVYAFALLSYTLLPLPSSAVAACVGGGAAPQLVPFAFVGDIVREGGVAGPRSLVANPAIAQAVLNVALFLPFGALVRHILRRGVLLTTLLGLLVSLFIEVTQLTGVWFLYPCAYRLFDVDDLLTNTLGALLGALVAPLVALVFGRPTGDPGTPRPITASRRLLGMLSDVLAVTLTTAALTAAVGVAAFVFGGPDAQRSVVVLAAAAVLPWAAPLAMLAFVLARGRTVGEAAVRLRPVGAPSPARLLGRWFFGVGGWVVLPLLPLVPGELLAAVLAVATLIGVWATRGRRGIAYAIMGIEIEDERTAPPA